MNKSTAMTLYQNPMDLKYSINPEYIVKAPRRNSERAAGIDVYLPEFNAPFLRKFADLNPSFRIEGDEENNNLIIAAFSRVLIPTGLYFDIPVGTYLDVGTKSGRFRDTGLKVGSHVIDSDYQGEVLISLFNTAAETAVLHSGQSIAQLIHKEYIHSSLIEIETFEDLYTHTTDRGTGGFGSTDGK